MGSSNRSDIYKDIVEALKEGNGNVHQIAESKKLNWKTVKVALDSLVAAGFVQLEDKKYVFKQSLDMNEHTLLGLPLSKEQEKQFCEIANRIQELSKKNLNKTFLQKAVVEVIKRDNIKNLPYGWYVYGECCVHKLEPDILQKFGSNKEHDSMIKAVLADFEKYPTTDELLEQLYQRENNELYLHRLTIIQVLKQPFTENAVALLKREFTQLLLSLARRKVPDEMYDWFDRFSSSFTMLSHLSVKEMEDHRMDIVEAFNTVWYLIGISNFTSVKKYYSSPIEVFFRIREDSLKDMLEVQLYRLKDSWPELKFDPKIEALRKKYTRKSSVP